MTVVTPRLTVESDDEGVLTQQPSLDGQPGSDDGHRASGAGTPANTS